MSIFQEYNSQLEKDIEISKRTFNISIAKILAQYTFESALCDTDYFTEATTQNDKKSSSFKSLIHTIIKNITDLFDNVIESLRKALQKKDHMTPNDYLSSKAANDRMIKDMKRIDAEIGAEMTKGCKLIQKISSATGVPDEEVHSFVAEVNKYLDDNEDLLKQTFIVDRMATNTINNLEKKKVMIKSTTKFADQCCYDREKGAKCRKIMNALSRLSNAACLSYKFSKAVTA